MRRLFHVAKIWFAALIERRGHADDHCIHFREPREIVGGAEMLGGYILLDFIGRDVPDVTLAAIELFDFVGVGVETRYAVSGLGKAQSERQTYVAATNNSDFKLRAFKIFRLTVRWHPSESPRREIPLAQHTSAGKIQYSRNR